MLNIMLRQIVNACLVTALLVLHSQQLTCSATGGA